MPDETTAEQPAKPSGQAMEEELEEGEPPPNTQCGEK